MNRPIYAVEHLTSGRMTRQEFVALRAALAYVAALFRDRTTHKVTITRTA